MKLLVKCWRKFNCCDAGIAPGLVSITRAFARAYSTTPELLKFAAETARAQTDAPYNPCVGVHRGIRHVCEPRGRLFDWLKTQREVADCAGLSPVSQLDRLGLLGRNFLAVHANYLASGDAEMLGRRHASVVHCPAATLILATLNFLLTSFRKPA